MNITKKRLLIYLGLSFGMAWLIFFIFIFTGHTWTGSSPEMLSLVSLGMLAPAIAHVITRKITNEGFRLIGEKSMMLGIDLKGKKWIFFLLAMFLARNRSEGEEMDFLSAGDVPAGRIFNAGRRHSLAGVPGGIWRN